MRFFFNFFKKIILCISLHFVSYFDSDFSLWYFASCFASYFVLRFAPEMTTLSMAVSCCEFEKVVKLVRAFADVNGDGGKLTPLQLACYNSHFGISEFLIDCGANVNMVNEKGRTALHYACKYGSLKIVRLLIRKGANINPVDNHGNTPLYFASKYGYDKDVVRELLKCGADYTITNKKGRDGLYGKSDEDREEFFTYIPQELKEPEYE